MRLTLAALRYMRDSAKAVSNEIDALEAPSETDRARFIRARRRWAWASERIGLRFSIPRDRETVAGVAYSELAA